MSEPIAGADLWRPVMEAAGWRCWCTGQCGAPHRRHPRGPQDPCQRPAAG